MAKALIFLLLVLLIFAAILLALAPLVGARTSQALSGVYVAQAGATLIEIDGIEVTVEGNHADLAHAEAAQIRNACKNNGHYQLWIEPNKTTFHRLCQLEDGRWGDWIVQRDGARKIEKSAFVPKDGSWKEVIDWLMRKGATRWTKPW